MLAGIGSAGTAIATGVAVTGLDELRTIPFAEGNWGYLGNTEGLVTFLKDACPAVLNICFSWFTPVLRDSGRSLGCGNVVLVDAIGEGRLIPCLRTSPSCFLERLLYLKGNHEY